MPWKAFGLCVHKLNDDGSKGELVKCHESKPKASAHVRALYANVDDVVQKMILEIAGEELQSIVRVTKEDGRYAIKVVSTAAMQDKEGETFTTEAMDYDIAHATRTGNYPEIRVFHSPLLGIGKVTKMSRVGIFAVDEGYSYNDDFSIAVCEKMLSNNNGKWRASRGFMALDVASQCNHCGSELGIQTKHMIAGFQCPNCSKMYLTFKGMPNVQYKKAITFDVTITDVPAVSMTSAAAFKMYDNEEQIMNKEQLKQRLLDAGLDETDIDARLANVNEKQLKELSDVPFAQVLKEFGAEDEAPEFYLDDTALDAIADRVVAKSTEAIAKAVALQVKELFEGMEVELDGGVAQQKEDNTDVLDAITELKELVDKLTQSDEQRLKELVTPNAKNRLRIYAMKETDNKKKKRMMMEEDDEEDMEDEEEMAMTPNGKKVKKSIARFFRDGAGLQQEDAILDGAGNQYKSLSEMVGAAVVAE